jgi:hypothetical protein
MPGVNTNISNAPAPPSRPTETGKVFAVGAAERGSTTAPVTVHSISELTAQLGKQVSGSYLIPSLEEFFFEGGTTAIIGRVAPATAVTASAVVQNAAKSQNVLNVFAASLGAWGNKLEVKFTITNGTIGIQVLESGVLVEQTTGLASTAAAVEWAEKSAYVRFAELRSELPIEGGVKLVSGSDGEAVSALGSASYATALNLFAKDLGCGQLIAPGVTSQAVQELLLKHGEERDRTPFVDAPLAEGLAGLKAASLALRNAVGARRGAMFSSWAIIPGLSPNTTRKVPWSAVQAGLTAVNDASTVPPQVNVAVAGVNAIPKNVVGLVNEFSRAEREELNEARVNAIRNVPITGIETYGNVTLCNPTTEPAWEELTAARLYMYVTAEGESILEKLMFDEIDPRKILFSKAQGLLTAMLEKLGNQLYNSPAEAVNCGSSVNTPETIKKKQLNAAVLVQASPAAETINLNITVKGV